MTSVIGEGFLHKPRAFQGQFRYGYVCDEEGIKVLDVTNPAVPRPLGALPLEDAHNIYLARTYAYVAAGKNGLVILDIEKPDAPRVDQVFNAGGCINDLHDVKLGITYVSEFAYLADGKNGMRVVQLTSPETPGNDGFSPRPTPRLIATFKIPKGGEALAISKGMDRDRAVDESGNQISVFGRIGARPFDLQQQRKLYLREGAAAPWWVSDDPRDPVYGPARPYQQGRAAPLRRRPRPGGSIRRASLADRSDRGPAGSRSRRASSRHSVRREQGGQLLEVLAELGRLVVADDLEGLAELVLDLVLPAGGEVELEPPSNFARIGVDRLARFGELRRPASSTRILIVQATCRAAS